MAGIEKVCEAIESGCYPGPDMYRFKRNNIQVCPEHRKLLAKKPHVLIIFRPETHYKTKKTYRHGLFEPKNIESVCHLNEPGARGLFINPGWGDLLPAKIVYQYNFCLFVPGFPGRVEGAYHNHTWSIGSTKRRLRRMLKQELNIVKVPFTVDEFYSDCVTYESRKRLLNSIFNLSMTPMQRITGGCSIINGTIIP